MENYKNSRWDKNNILMHCISTGYAICHLKKSIIMKYKFNSLSLTYLSQTKVIKYALKSYKQIKLS